MNKHITSIMLTIFFFIGKSPLNLILLIISQYA
nr:MAG TPA: hypothetical protein [Bacteriophage sp.]